MKRIFSRLPTTCFSDFLVSFRLGLSLCSPPLFPSITCTPPPHHHPRSPFLFQSVFFRTGPVCVCLELRAASVYVCACVRACVRARNVLVSVELVSAFMFFFYCPVVLLVFAYQWLNFCLPVLSVVGNCCRPTCKAPCAHQCKVRLHCY